MPEQLQKPVRRCHSLAMTAAAVTQSLSSDDVVIGCSLITEVEQLYLQSELINIEEQILILQMLKRRHGE